MGRVVKLIISCTLLCFSVDVISASNGAVCPTVENLQSLLSSMFKKCFLYRKRLAESILVVMAHRLVTEMLDCRLRYIKDKILEKDMVALEEGMRNRTAGWMFPREVLI